MLQIFPPGILVRNAALSVISRLAGAFDKNMLTTKLTPTEKETRKKTEKSFFVRIQYLLVAHRLSGKVDESLPGKK